MQGANRLYTVTIQMGSGPEMQGSGVTKGPKRILPSFQGGADVQSASR